MKKKVNPKAQLIVKVDELTQANIDLREARRAALNLVEDSVLAREALQISEEKYRAVFEAMVEACCIFEMIYDDRGRPVDWKILEANAGYEKQTGLKNVAGKLASEVMPGTEAYWIETFNRVVETGEAQEIERWHQPTGRWIHSSTARVGGPGSRRLISVFYDITERKNNEQRQEFLLNLSDALRAERGVEAVGNRAVKMIADQLGADRVYLVALIPGDDNIVVTHEARRPDMPPLKGSYRGSDFPSAVKEIFERTIVYKDVRKDERLAEAEKLAFAGLGAVGFMAAPIRRGGAMIWAGGAVSAKPRAWTATEIRMFEDAVERTWAAVERAKSEEALIKSEEQLRSMNARLQDTDRAKTNFFNNVSHEFRTPLTLLIGPLEELIRSGGSKLTPEDMQSLQFAFRGASRLQKLVTTLLDFARIEAGKLEAYYQPTDFAKITSDLAGNFRSAIEKAGLKFVVKTEQIAEPIYLNREMWEKIVFNLLSNAFKFTHTGKIEVLIREKLKNAELRIIDTGVGIAPNDIDRIFDRFTRIEGAKARTHEGTGIGLALVRELVAAHGGTIKVKSEQGVGSEFIVSIPKGKAHFAKHQIFENRERPPVKDMTGSFTDEILGWLPDDVRMARRKLKKYQQEGAARILIVEDNADMREYLSNVLSEDDHKIFAVEDGQKVLTFLEEGGQTDLILSDVMMPALDGFEMIKKIKADARFSHIPVIFLTAKTAEDSKVEGLRIGAEAYLTKPFSSKELRAIVLSTLKRHVK
jgi:signal transduction histidine kinase/CheY-like chemotaxis protein